MKVFISQPMRGLSEAKIITVRERIFGDFQAKYPDAELIDNFVPTSEERLAVKHAEVQLLGRSVCRLADADIVIMAKGWENHPGCRIEHKIATYYDIPVKYA